MESDAQLVALACEGDHRAFEQLVERHRPLLEALCSRMAGCRGLAEDAAHEAILHAMLDLPHLRQPDRFGPWLGGIGLNVCRRMLREATRESPPLDLEGGRLGTWPESGPDPALAAEETELVRSVRRAVLDLPPGQRSAVLLFYLSGLSEREVARTLEIAPTAVKARLFKARKALKRDLLILWKEYNVSDSPSVQLEVVDVRESGEQEERQGHMVLLREPGGNRGFPIWIGSPEGAAIAALLEGVETPRPMTHALASAAIKAVGGRVVAAHVGQLLDDVFYATLVLQGPQGEARVDARPSDALALALASGGSITVDGDVFERVARDYPEESWDRTGAPQVLTALREQMQRRGQRTF